MLFNQHKSTKYDDLGFPNESNELQEASVACSESSSYERVELDLLPKPSDVKSELSAAGRPSARERGPPGLSSL